MRQRIISLFLWTFVAGTTVLAGCGGGNSPTEPDGSNILGITGADPQSSAGGSLTVKMIDAPTDEICELHVYIKDLRVKPDGQPQMLLGTEIGDFDLLELQDGPPAVLGDFAIDQGLYQFVEILLDESQSYVIEKEDPADPSNTNCMTLQSPLQIPSAKFKVAGGPFNVDENTTITIDFDADKSLGRKGGNGKDKGWTLRPDVSITSVEP
jgi:hypothetical protein